MLAAFEIGIHSHEAELVPAHRHEMAVARWLGRSQESHDFQPADKAAALLAHALPPAAAWCHKNQRGKTLVASRDLGRNVEGLSRGSFYSCHNRYFGVLLRPLL